MRYCIILAFIFFISGCFASNFEPDEDDGTPPDVIILDVNINPNPATVGDTINFKVVIDDSLRSDLEYRWILPGTNNSASDIVETTTSMIEWAANVSLGDYTGIVQVDDLSTPGAPPQKSFNFTVIE